MNFAEKWHNHTRQVKNAIVVLIIDFVLLIGAVLSIPGLKGLWDVLTSFLPNIYEPIFLQLVAAIRGSSPSAVVASGTVLTFLTMFLSLLTIHALIGWVVGYLFQRLKPTITWSVVNYVVLVLVLFCMHLTLILRNYWFLL